MCIQGEYFYHYYLKCLFGLSREFYTLCFMSQLLYFYYDMDKKVFTVNYYCQSNINAFGKKHVKMLQNHIVETATITSYIFLSSHYILNKNSF